MKNKISAFALKVIILVICVVTILVGKKLISGNDSEGQHNIAAATAIDFNNISYGEDNITVNGCKLSVYVASDIGQKAKGMLGFIDTTFKKDGMIFLGDDFRNHYYHTMGMKIDIMIMALVKIGDKAYSVAEEPLFAPSGIENIKLQGESILEIPVKKYNEGLKACLKLDTETKK